MTTGLSSSSGTRPSSLSNPMPMYWYHFSRVAARNAGAADRTEEDLGVRGLRELLLLAVGEGELDLGEGGAQAGDELLPEVVCYDCLHRTSLFSMHGGRILHAGANTTRPGTGCQPFGEESIFRRRCPDREPVRIPGRQFRVNPAAAAS